MAPDLTFAALVNNDPISFLPTQLEDLKIIRSKDNELLVDYCGEEYLIEVVKEDPINKRFRFKIQEECFEVKLRQRPNKSSQSFRSIEMLERVEAPLPGLITNIFVKKNQLVKKGDNLFILEAMKMENSFVAKSDGVIKEVSVPVNSKVNQDQQILEIVYFG